MTIFARIASLLLMAILGIGGVLLVGTAGAQEDPEEEKSRFVRFVEDQISAPGFDVSIGSIDGVLSSDVRFAYIAVSDDQGEYLRIENVHLVWSRLALLRGRLDVDLLEADRILYTRNPVPSGPPDPAASEFSVPELPVEVVIDRLAVPEVVLGQPVVGEEVVLSVDGSISLAGGELDSDLQIVRTNAPGGRFAIQAAYSNESEQLDLDLALEEPQNGFVSNLLGIPGRPALGFRIAGSGPISNFAADIALSAAGEQLVDGTATISAVEGGYRFQTDVTGNLQPLVPETYAAYVAGSSRLVIDATRAEAGGVALRVLDLRSGVLSLQASGDLAPDGFPTRITVDGQAGQEGQGSVVLPGDGAGSIGSGSFQVSFGGEGETWSAVFDVNDFRSATLSADRARIEAGGAARNLQDPAARSLTFDVTGDLTGVDATDPALAEALGDFVTLAATGSWAAGQETVVERAFLRNENAAVNFAGEIGEDVSGRYRLNAASLEPFSGLAGRDLAGSVDLALQGDVALVGGGFDLTIDGTAQDLAAGIPNLDPLLSGTTDLDGRVVRNTEGLRFDDLVLANAQAEVRVNGAYDLDASDLTLAARIQDLAVVTPQASGAVALEARLVGESEIQDLDAVLRSDALTLSGQTLRGAVLRFDGTLAGTELDGDLAASGTLQDLPIDLAARIESEPDGTRRLQGLNATAGETRVAGDLTILPTGLLDGNLRVSSPDVSVVAPLFLTEASGAVEANVTLAPEGGIQTAAVQATATDLQVATVTVGSAAIDATVSDLFGRPVVNGETQATAVAIGEVTIETLRATATRAGDGFQIEADAAVEGGGTVDATGSIGDTLDLTVAVDDLPAAIANGFVPDLGASGTLTLDARVTGTFAAPEVAFTASGANLTSTVLGRAGLTSLALEATGDYAGDVATLDATVTGNQGLTIAVDGRIPLAGDGLEVSVDLSNLPAAVANGFVPDLGAAGTIAASAEVTGSLTAPAATYSVTGSGLTANALRAAGLSPLSLRATGDYAGNAVTTEAAVTGAEGLTLTANGRVPLSGDGLDLAVTGSAPLAIANAFLAERATRVTGTARIDARVTGSTAAPNVTGAVTIDGATLNDPESGNRLTGIGATIRFDGTTATIERLVASPARGGSISGSGTVGLTGDRPVDVTVTLTNAGFASGELAQGNLSGTIAVDGTLAGTTAIGGRLTVNRVEITIPESLPGRATLLDVRHRLPPVDVRRTLERARLATENRADAADGAEPAGFVLDGLVIDAPARIFVRGRGIDAELGGSVTLTGPVSSVQPVGSFELIRGRLDIIGQRITFDRGSVTLVGDLDPLIDFAASTSNNGISVTASVTGRASDPEIVLTSSPELPQDEILAQFLFGRSITELSPVQIARLAAAVAQLAGGGGGPDLLGRLRDATGLDDLDVVTDSSGNAAVQAGRYISENVYLGVTAGGNGQSRVSVNLDITDNLKARAEVGAQGGSKAGIYYEKEY